MKSISVLGIFVADLAFFGDTIPLIGELADPQKCIAAATKLPKSCALPVDAIVT